MNKKSENKKNNETILNFKRTWKYIKKAKGYLVGYVLISIFEAILSIILPLVSANIILNITDGLFEQLIYTGLAVLGIQLGTHLLGFLKVFFYRGIYDITIESLKTDLTKSVLNLEIKELEKTSSGFFIDRINNDTDEVSGVFMEFAYWISYVISNIGVLVMIFILNKYVFVFSIAATIICYLVRKRSINIQYKLEKELKKIRENITSLSSEVIRGIRDVKVLNATESTLNTMKSRIHEMTLKRKKLILTRNRHLSVELSIRAICSFLFLCLGAKLYELDLLTIPTFIILYNYLNKVYNLLNGVAQLSEYIKKFNLASSRIYEVMYDDTYEKEQFGDLHIDNIVGNIELKNVSFKYNDDKEIINNLSLKIKENETVAIVGKSGAGKTTLFSLITYLYKPTKGKVLIDGIDISKLDCESIRNNISIITQNPYIFNMSIKDNLLLTVPNANDEEIKTACKISALDKFIDSLSDGYDTIIGEGGVNLSGGQRQRLAIARALLEKTKIILFDEATSALDNETQNEIQESIKNMKGDYTIVIVAHRLSTIMDADKIYVLDEGHIVEEGTHNELIKSSKVYKNLYNKENNE